jgi:hypothetical protein
MKVHLLVVLHRQVHPLAFQMCNLQTAAYTQKAWPVSLPQHRPGRHTSGGHVHSWMQVPSLWPCGLVPALNL